LALGLIVGIGVAWWLSRDTTATAQHKAQHAQRAAAANADDPRPALYRWRDGAGNLQVTSTPPAGRTAERIDVQPRDGIEIHGDR
ncbi:MAG: DUF4124 domain-containing protein, partial [Luteimonas sp.]